MAENEKHGGVIEVTAELLAAVLHLPKGARIVQVLRKVNPPDVYEVYVTSESSWLPVVQEGAHWPIVRLDFYKTPDGVRASFAWNAWMPKAETEGEP